MKKNFRKCIAIIGAVLLTSTAVIPSINTISAFAAETADATDYFDVSDVAIKKTWSVTGIDCTLYDNGLLVLTGQDTNTNHSYPEHIAAIVSDGGYDPYRDILAISVDFDLNGMPGISFGSWGLISELGACRVIKFGNTFKASSNSITTMDYMFKGCKSLVSINLSGVNTSNVTNVSHMFDCCDSITDINLSDLSFTNVVYAGSMLANCTNLKSVSLSTESYNKLKTFDDLGINLDDVATRPPVEYTADGSHDLSVTATVDSSYTVQLPATLELSQSGNDLMHYAGDFTVGAKGAITRAQAIEISTGSTTFTMTGTNNNTASASYSISDSDTVTFTEGVSDEQTEDTVILAKDGTFVTADGKVEVTFPAADTYTGTAGFTFSLK